MQMIFPSWLYAISMRHRARVELLTFAFVFFTDEYDKHPNEVVKNEELTYNSASDRRATNTLSWLLLVCVVAHRWGFHR